MASVDENLGLTVESLTNFSKMISDQLSHSEMKSLLSLIDSFNNKGITLSVFSKSIQVLFDNRRNTKQDRGYKVDENLKKSGAHVKRIRVKIDENPKEDVSDGKKRRIIHTEQTERTLKKSRISRLLDRVTPSYKLIPEEQQHPVSHNHVLNSKYYVMQFNGASRPRKQTKYEKAMDRCEEDMFETDMLMGALEGAVESAEKVIKEEMSVEELGVKFYRCIEMLYGGDMLEIVREDHKKALPVFLNRLKNKLEALTVARQSWKPRWKQVFEENTARQREATQQKTTRKKTDGKQQNLNQILEHMTN